MQDLTSTAGTMQETSIRPDLDPRMFPPVARASISAVVPKAGPTIPNSSKARVPPLARGQKQDEDDRTDYGDDGVPDADLVDIENAEIDFHDIDELDLSQASEFPKIVSSQRSKGAQVKTGSTDPSWMPRRLPNGNWECNHKCADKEKCKHVCCKEGTESKPKLRKKKDDGPASEQSTTKPPGKVQTKLQLESRKSQQLAHPPKAAAESISAPRNEASVLKNVAETKIPAAVDTLNRLHGNVRQRTQVKSLANVDSEYSYARGTRPSMSFLEQEEQADPTHSPQDEDKDFDVDDLDDIDDLQSLNKHAPLRSTEVVRVADNKEFGGRANTEDEDEDEDLLDAALIGAEDSFHLASVPMEQDELMTTDDAPIEHDKHVDRVGEPVPATSPMKDLFVSDNSSTPLPLLEPRSSVPRKRNTNHNEEANETFEARDPSSKRQKQSDLSLPDNRVGAGTEEDAFEGPAPDVEDAPQAGRDSPRTAELRRWVFQEFGDCVELI